MHIYYTPQSYSSVVIATSSSVCFPFSCNFVLFFLSKIFFRSRSIFNRTISTLLGLIPTLTVAPFAFSRCTLSICKIHFFLYTLMTLPAWALLKGPRVTRTSSSFLTGTDRTEYFCLSSLDNGADISFLLTLLGAEKCAFRHFLREDDTAEFFFMAGSSTEYIKSPM